MESSIRVECYSGSRYGERPLAFVLHDERHVVRLVEKSWRTPSALHFRVCTTKDQTFELIYDEGADTWQILTPLESQEGQL